MKLDALRQLIREEMRTVIKEELKDILTEAVIIASSPEMKSTPIGVGGQGVLNNKPFKEVKSTHKPSFSKIMAEVKKPKSSGDPLIDLLNETAQAGEWRSLNGDGYNASDAVSWAGGMPGGNVQVGTVDQMLAKPQHVSDINEVRIDVVPDFTDLMSKLKERGSI